MMPGSPDLRSEGCIMCPRRCGADRLHDMGVCGAGRTMRIARAGLHFWEEPPISGARGSGTIFFSHCALQCVYCQNAEISARSARIGDDVSVEDAALLMLHLQAQGAQNINLVTASHFSPEAAQAVRIGRAHGLRLPVVWNSSGYESPETLDALDDVIDVFLPDFKYWSSDAAARYSHAADYPQTARQAISKMLQMRPKVSMGPNGIMERGVIVRHLVLPGRTRDAKLILRHLRDTCGLDIHVSIMRQYTPPSAPLPYSELNRTVRSTEYASVVRFAEHLGLENVFIQDASSANDAYVPPFTGVREMLRNVRASAESPSL